MPNSPSTTIAIDAVVDAINREIDRGWSLSDLAHLCDIPASVLKDVWHNRRRIQPSRRQHIIAVCDYLDRYDPLADANSAAEYIRLLSAQTMDFSDIDKQLNWPEGHAYFICHNVITRVTTAEEEKLRAMVFDQVDDASLPQD